MQPGTCGLWLKIGRDQLWETVGEEEEEKRRGRGRQRRGGGTLSLRFCHILKKHFSYSIYERGALPYLTISGRYKRLILEFCI